MSEPAWSVNDLTHANTATIRAVAEAHAQVIEAEALCARLAVWDPRRGYRAKCAARAARTCIEEVHKILLGDPMESGGETWFYGTPRAEWTGAGSSPEGAGKGAGNEPGGSG